MFTKILFLDAPLPWQLGFQSPATAIMEGIINFHHDLFFFIVIIIVFVYYMLARCVVLYIDKNDNRKPINVTHASVLEIVWTIIPAIILFLIALPSFSLLYSMDEMVEPLMTVKVIGNQWYWSYELLDPVKVMAIFPDHDIADEIKVDANGVNKATALKLPVPVEEVDLKSIEINYVFDSYMLQDIEKGQHRLLDVDNKLYLPANINIRLLITANDVLHSWAVPAFGIKLDSVPGRLNQTLLNIKREGVFYGQCSEICGINHAFMPIVVKSIDLHLTHEITQDTFNAIYPIFMLKYYRTNA